MKTRPIVIHVPVMRLPSSKRVWALAWRIAVLFGVITVGSIGSALWPEQSYSCGIATGVWLNCFWRDLNWNAGRTP